MQLNSSSQTAILSAKSETQFLPSTPHCLIWMNPQLVRASPSTCAQFANTEHETPHTLNFHFPEFSRSEK